ncbi:GM23303 [Drosophila sechellia]|uniref:GM23303 n=1 Tax=Drosophila sechellia TaxID=7238 RepID=B4IFG4_DROSE|nr:GM23303 [Drosophila sechellia]
MISFSAILALVVSSVWATDYTLEFEDSDLYAECSEKLPGAIGLREAFDMRTELDMDGLHLSGNCTTVWDVPSTNRIALRMSVMHFDRGTWQPTVFNTYAPDFCAVMFDKELSWYKYWLKYLPTAKRLGRSALEAKVTVLVYKPFIMKPLFQNVIGPTYRGRVKGVFNFESYDKNNVREPTFVCFEVRGQLGKIKL